jgi:hypothetical protein
VAIKVPYFANAAGQLMSAPVDESPTVRIGRPTPVAGAPGNIMDISTAPDGRLLLLRREPAAKAPLEIVEHWTAMAGASR